VRWTVIGIIAPLLGGCGQDHADAVMPQIEAATLAVVAGQPQLDVSLTLQAPASGPSLVAVERIGLFDSPPADDAPPLAELHGDFALGTDRIVGPSDTKHARIVDAGTLSSTLLQHCGQRRLLHLCIWSAKPQAPLVAGCDWLDGVEVRCP